MIRYLVIEPSANEWKVSEIQDTYWFTTPIKKEGYKHKYMADVHQISHWKKSAYSWSDTCYIDIYTYGDEKPILINGWRFKTTGIRSNYASSNRFDGMELWFKCTTPEGKDIEWYYNDHKSVTPHKVLQSYFAEIHRISQYRSEEEAKKNTYNDPYLHVRR